MPPAAPAAAGAAGAAGQPANQRQQGGFLSGLIRMGMMYYFMKNWMGGKNSGPTKDGIQPVDLSPKLSRGLPVDVFFYISEHPTWQDTVAVDDDIQPIWTASSVPLGTTPTREYTYVYHPSEAVQNNGSVYIHTVFTPNGGQPSPSGDGYDAATTFVRSSPLNRYLPKLKAKEGMNLLSGKNSTDDQAVPDDYVVGNETIIMNYLKPNITVTLVDDYKTYKSNQIPPFYKGIIDIDPETQTYWPHVWYNDFWLLRDYMIPVNETLTELPIHFTIDTVAVWKLGLYLQMEQSFSMQQEYGMATSSEADDVKRIFLEGNPYFLALTVVVSMLHSLFDVLAFKNDIGFWKNNKSMRGLSARTIMINCFCQAVVFFYLLDNETSMVVLFSAGVGTCIEFWKVTKAMNVTIAKTASGIPYVKFQDRASYTNTKTDQYDAEAMRYLSYVLYPLVFGYGVYSLVYQTHKSWYSWLLNTLVGAVYTFGFILMCPQLYLNYRLKSVAHLPWKQMTYKFLTTIIDDLFAFVIKMPLLHRLSVFRDDLVFCVYIYQRWIYRVDKTRANEFGYVEEHPEEDSDGEGEEGATAATVAEAKAAVEAVAGSTSAETKKDK